MIYKPAVSIHGDYATTVGACRQTIVDCGLHDHHGSEDIEHRKRILHLQFHHIIASWLTNTIAWCTQRAMHD